VKQLFPIDDRIEYQTGRGYFSGIIRGYEVDKYGVSLDLGDRRFPIWDDEDIEMAEKYHKWAGEEPYDPPTPKDVSQKVVQLTLF
jgi:hypothetical protein